MKYNLIVNQEKKTIDFAILNQDLRVEINDKVYHIEFTKISENQMLINVNGSNVNAFISDDKEGKTIIIKGRYYEILNANLIEQHLSLEDNFASTSSAISPPTPAVVTKVLVKIGDIVKKGQGLVTVSAMKMEITLSSPFNGIVSGIKAKEGNKVMPSDVLVNVKKHEDNI